MGIESRSFPELEGLDLEQITVGCLSQTARDRLGIRLDENREALHQALRAAARNLAYFNIRYIPADPFVAHAALRCDECKQEQRRLESGALKTKHAPTCRTGAVLAIVELLDGLGQLAPAAVDVKPFIYRSVAQEGGRK